MGCAMAAVIAVAVLAMSVVLSVFILKQDGPSNVTNREKLELGYGYPDDTLTDGLGWIHDPSGLNRSLKHFYEVTGAEPYVALVSVPEVTAEGPDAEWEYADAWYRENLPNEGYVLFMYFDPGDGTDGNGQLVAGSQAGVLMDAEAQDVFWEYMDHYWGQDIDEDTLFSETFNKTADRIMQRRTEAGDVLKYVFLCLAAACLAGGAIAVMSVRRKHEAQRAAETERILNTPVPDLAEGDPLLKQYGSRD